ncbi:methyl-accepting chemotaxis protein [Noviherbaspirillum saxi]|uniref:Methyl-accepting chemotaxis protein n=1 Tax=Noviherbaspirillum saxi TaxID=2320863 RepID=A0A3A3FFW0_9BURK|nr:methyl-accepting chemotaxis protein [Noviherbaspirillum saxi]RJF92256.1 methyl-accepting chemotaxis protein [Noviherbaspirillum saxi]
MNIAKLKVGTRLAIGFGLVLSMMAMLSIAGIAYLAQIDSVTTRIITKEWVKADAAGTLNAMTRENARLTLQLFIAPDRPAQQQIHAQINANKAIIDKALEALERTIYMEQGKHLLENIRDSRQRYVASFTGVARLLEEGREQQAEALMTGQTLPLLQRLQDKVKELSDLQKSLVEAGRAEVQQSIDAARFLMLASGLAAAVIGIAAAIVITRGLTRQLGGEPGDVVEIAARIAQGDVGVNIDIRAGDQSSLLFAMKSMRDKLGTMVGRVRAGADTVTAASVQLAAGNLDLSVRTEEQASALQETASSMEELASTVDNNAANAQQARQLVQSASDVATQGGKVVERVVATMHSINESSMRIADITEVIDNIAFQTNILALNAAVEAARAGEQGRGFAVVASEVRALARRAACAAKEIKQLIDDSVERVQAGTTLAGEAGATTDRIIASVCRVADIMNEIAAASGEQSNGIQQINQAISQMDEVTQQNAALVEQAAAASASLQEQAKGLAQAMSVFKAGEGAAATVIEPVPEKVAAATRSGDTPLLLMKGGRDASPVRVAAAQRARTVGAPEGHRQEWEEF